MPSPAQPILKLARIKVHLDYQAAVETVKRATGKGALRQAMEIARFALGPYRFSAEEYFLDGLWRPELSREDRASFISERRSAAFNRQLSPVDKAGLHGLLTDKLLTGLVLRAAGFPVLKPLAIFGRVVRLPGVERLGSAGDIVDFLRRDGSLPVFGKPLHASLSIGAASYIGLADGGDSIVLGDGRIVGLKDLAVEIAAHFARGYVFEPLIRQHPDVERATGSAVGSLRIVTLRTANDVETLYTMQRLPAVGAMMDATHPSGPYAAAQVDPETGRIIKAQTMDSMELADLKATLVTGVRFDTVVLPFMKEAHALALDVHRLLVRPGVLGFDVALTPDGPLITEINNNPFHTLYQQVVRRGFLNAEFRPRIEAALRVVRAESGMT